MKKAKPAGITGVRLRGLREGLSLTQPQLSKRLGISETALRNYERGIIVIAANALRKYAIFFNVSADYILGRCDDPQGAKYNYQPEYLKAICDVTKKSKQNGCGGR